MTGQYYVPPPSGPNIFNQGLSDDVLYRGARSTVRAGIKRQNSFRLIEPPREFRGIVQPWELTIYDFTGGLGPYSAPFSLSPNTYTWADGIDPTRPGYILLSQLGTTATSPDPTGTLVGIHAEFIFSRLIWGIGAGANVSLIKETSATDPTPTAITYTPASSICSLGQVVIGGGTVDRRLIVGIVANAAQIIGDATGTVDATMNAATASLWWIVQTSLPGASGGFVILMQNATTISTLTTISATGDAPVSATANVPEGGFLIKPGEFALADGPFGGVNRVWVVLPKDNQTAGMLVVGGPAGFVTSMNLEGTDLQKLEFNEMTNGVYQAAYIVSPVHGPSVVATDYDRVVIHNGAVEENLHILSDIKTTLALSETTLNAAIDYFKVRGFTIDGPNLYVWVQATDAAGGVASTITLWLYDWASGRWHIVSEPLSAGSVANAEPIRTAGHHQISPNTRFVNVYTDGNTSWERIQVLPVGERPYPTTAPVTGVTSAFATDGVVRSTHWVFDGMEGKPGLIESVEMTGDLNNSGTNAAVLYEQARSSGFGTFEFPSSGQPGYVSFNDSTQYDSGAGFRRRNYRRWPENIDYFFDFHCRITITQGSSDTTRSPMVNGVIVRGLTFLDGVVRTPKEVWGF